MKSFRLQLPTRVRFGLDCISELPGLVALWGGVALVVTDQELAHRTDIPDRVLTQLREYGVETACFSEVSCNPRLATVRRGRDAARRHQCRVIVGLGGGSALDAAKGIAAPDSTRDALPLIAVPTTAGSGSEVTPYAVFTVSRDARIHKEIHTDPSLYPHLALLDPRLTVTAPPAVTIDSGLDALTHALESYTSRRSRAVTTVLAEEAVRRIITALPAAYRQPRDLRARTSLLYASLLAGMCISQTGTTIVHSLSYPLTCELGLSHGRANAILLPVVCDYNAPADIPRFARLACLFHPEASQLRPVEAARRLGTLIRRFLRKLDLPACLPGTPPSEEDLARFASGTLTSERRLTSNPRRPTESDLQSIYRRLFSPSTPPESQGHS